MCNDNLINLYEKDYFVVVSLNLCNETTNPICVVFYIENLYDKNGKGNYNVTREHDHLKGIWF